MFTQSDMNLSNFGVDEQDETVLMDLEEIGLLPGTFVAHMISTHAPRPFLAPWICHDSNTSMANIRWFLGLVSDPKLVTST